MQQANQWLKRVMSIEEGRPYHSNLTVEFEWNDDISSLSNETMNINGITLFHVKNGRLAFDFFIDDNDMYTASLAAYAASNVTLAIPPLDFEHPVMFNAILANNTTLRGTVDVEYFGDNDTPLSGIDIQLTGLPKSWYGTDSWTHFEGLTLERVQHKEDRTLVIPNGNAGLRHLSGFTLKTDGWNIVLREMPLSTKANPNITHLCRLTKENGTLTGAIARVFIEENLFPFLDLVFGQKTRFHTMIGYKEGIDSWVIASQQSAVPIKTAHRNWFLRSRGSNINIPLLFRHFCDKAPETKKHLRKVIQQYADSEEIMDALGRPTVAASISFAALEGLTRSIINTYPCKDEWLQGDLSLKRGKNITEAIEMVANQKFGNHSTTFEEASKEIRKIRNATFHTDLTSEPDHRNAYYRWNSSQALIEFLLLDELGLDQIPNRTAHGTFNVMGKDMFAEVRSEELTFE